MNVSPENASGPPPETAPMPPTTVPAGDLDPMVVVLAAGKGTRMNSDLPKVLCRVVDRPMIHFVLDAADQAGIGKKIVVVGYEAQQVRAELDSRGQADIVYALQSEQLGTGHAVQMCLEHLQGHQGLTLVIAGDSPLVQSESLRTLIDHFDRTRPALLLGTLTKDNPEGLGRILRNEQGQFIGIVEHKDATEAERQTKEVNMSTYLFSTPDLVWALSNLSNENAQGEYYLTDCARLLREAGRDVEALPVLKDCESLSINNPDELALVDQTMRKMGYA
ncbi:Bifunctional protein GlmU [Neorhodopirellula pilleata]|uniref:Bifunctional protein GlmU n=2 Tax=Neorhodopirellula pilleata TaxID=2714738 RepID=A0A5C6ABP9_9BACT|nr:Bifunctional protein GlmU [Neorhodopirellula pilleata]